MHQAGRDQGGEREPRRPLTMAFRDGTLERAYLDATADHVLRSFRALAVFGWITFVALWFADPVLVGSPANGAVLSKLRLAIGAPILLLGVAFGYVPRRWFRRAWAYVALTWVGVTMAVPLAAIARMPEPDRLDVSAAFSNLLSLVMAGCLVLPVRFVNALGFFFVVSAPTLAVLVGIRPSSAEVAVPLYLFGCTVGLIGAWQIEQRQRQAFVASRRLDQERARSERLLHNVLPVAIAERLKEGAPGVADSFETATVLFADLAGFTPLAAEQVPERVVEILNHVFTRFDELAAEHGVEKIKTIGDAYMLVAGVPEPRADHAEAAAEIALAMQGAIGEISRAAGQPLQLRIGACSGPVVAGVIGVRKFAYDLWGDTVNTAARMESHGVPGRIQVAETTYLALRDRYAFEERGVIDVKGKGPMRTYFLQGRTP